MLPKYQSRAATELCCLYLQDKLFTGILLAGKSWERGLIGDKTYQPVGGVAADDDQESL